MMKRAVKNKNNKTMYWVKIKKRKMGEKKTIYFNIKIKKKNVL
jgi:hypothetical protein